MIHSDLAARVYAAAISLTLLGCGTTARNAGEPVIAVPLTDAQAAAVTGSYIGPDKERQREDRRRFEKAWSY